MFSYNLNINFFKNFRNIHVFTLPVITAKWLWGSRMNVIFNWGDGKETMNVHSDNTRNSIATHNYSVPGRYYGNVTIFNYLLDCSNQTLKYNAENIEFMYNVLYNISGLEIRPNLFAWNRTVPLKFTIFLDQGTWINVTIDWNDTTSNFFYVNNLTGIATNVSIYLILYFFAFFFTTKSSKVLIPMK